MVFDIDLNFPFLSLLMWNCPYNLSKQGRKHSKNQPEQYKKELATFIAIDTGLLTTFESLSFFKKQIQSSVIELNPGAQENRCLLTAENLFVNRAQDWGRPCPMFGAYWAQG